MFKGPFFKWVLTFIALVATTQAYVLEFSDDALNNLRLNDPQEASDFAVAINLKSELEFLLSPERTKNELKFQANNHKLLRQRSASKTRHPVCENYHGIKLKRGNKFFCKITKFTIRVAGHRSQPQTMTFVLYFNEQDLGMLVLRIPIFQIPSTIPEESNDEELEEWANQKPVGLKAPFTFDQLLAAQNGSPLKMKFKWLRDLFLHPIEKRVNNFRILPNGKMEKITVYVTSPLLLPKNLIESCLNAVQLLDHSQEESVGSNSLTSYDSSDNEVPMDCELCSGDEESRNYGTNEIFELSSDDETSSAL